MVCPLLLPQGKYNTDLWTIYRLIFICIMVNTELVFYLRQVFKQYSIDALFSIFCCFFITVLFQFFFLFLSGRTYGEV